MPRFSEDFRSLHLSVGVDINSFLRTKYNQRRNGVKKKKLHGISISCDIPCRAVGRQTVVIITFTGKELRCGEPLTVHAIVSRTLTEHEVSKPKPSLGTGECHPSIYGALSTRGKPKSPPMWPQRSGSPEITPPTCTAPLSVSNAKQNRDPPIYSHMISHKYSGEFNIPSRPTCESTQSS